MNETTLQASEDELAIRAAWVELNAAHVNRDLNMTVKYWLPEVNTIGGGGGLWAGLEQNIQGFSKIFQDPSFSLAFAHLTILRLQQVAQRKPLKLEFGLGRRRSKTKKLLTVVDTLLCGSL
ncbi:MAG: hypothetical protein ACI9UD_002885 [Glaciecola sp.]|jgi:hypothetical protein